MVQNLNTNFFSFRAVSTRHMLINLFCKSNCEKYWNCTFDVASNSGTANTVKKHHNNNVDVAKKFNVVEALEFDQKIIEKTRFIFSTTQIDEKISHTAQKRSTCKPSKTSDIIEVTLKVLSYNNS